VADAGAAVAAGSAGQPSRCRSRRPWKRAHYPDDFGRRDAALRRLGFDELLALQIGMVAATGKRRVAVGEPVAVPPARVLRRSRRWRRALTEQVHARMGAADPARLTPDQAAAVEAIVSDLGQARPMMRLLRATWDPARPRSRRWALAFVADAGRQGALLRADGPARPSTLWRCAGSSSRSARSDAAGPGRSPLVSGASAQGAGRAARRGGLLGLTSGRVVVGNARARAGSGPVRRSGAGPWSTSSTASASRRRGARTKAARHMSCL